MKVILKAKGIQEIRDIPESVMNDKVIILAYVQSRQIWDKEGSLQYVKPEKLFKAWYKLDEDAWEKGMPVYNFIEREAVITYEDFYENQK